MADLLNIRMTPNEKHAIRILAAKQNLSMSFFVLQVLRKNTPLKDVVDSLGSYHPHVEELSTTGRNKQSPETA